MSNPFSNIKNSSGDARGEFFSDGFKGQVDVDSCKFFESQKDATWTWIVEVEVTETNMAEAHPVGWNGIWMVRFDKYPKSSADKVKGFIDQLLGKDWADSLSAEQVQTFILEELTGTEQPFAGTAFNLECKAKEEGGFVNYRWKAVEAAVPFA